MAYYNPSGPAGIWQDYRKPKRRIRFKKKKHYMDIVGPVRGKGPKSNWDHAVQSKLGKTSIKKGKALMESINPLRRTELYQKGSKAKRAAIDSAWMSTMTMLFNAIPGNPVELESPFGLPFGPTYPTWRGFGRQRSGVWRKRRRRYYGKS